MGAHGDSGYAWIADPALAYARLWDEAAWEDGHGGYSGTIATSRGYFKAKGIARPLTVWEAARYVCDHDLLDNMDKWDAWGAIPIFGKDRDKIRTRKLRLPVPEGMTAHEYRYDRNCAPAIIEALGDKPIAAVTASSLGGDRAKVTAATVKGERTTRYYYTEDSRGNTGDFKLSNRSYFGPFDSQAEAYAAAKEEAKKLAQNKYHNTLPSRYDVVSITTKGGAPLATVTVEPTAKNIEATVSYYPARPVKPEGWYFFGWAAS